MAAISHKGKSLRDVQKYVHSLQNQYYEYVYDDNN